MKDLAYKKLKQVVRSSDNFTFSYRFSSRLTFFLL